MKTIHKFAIDISGMQSVRVPNGARWLCVHEQRGKIALWAEVDPDAEKEAVLIEVFGTGAPIKSDIGTSRVYLGTAFVGDFVWHVYQRLN